MRILAFLTEPAPAPAILRHPGLPATPPPLSPARGPPQPDLAFHFEPALDLDQTAAFDPAEPEPIPDFDDSIRTAAPVGGAASTSDGQGASNVPGTRTRPRQPGGLPPAGSTAMASAPAPMPAARWHRPTHLR